MALEDVGRPRLPLGEQPVEPGQVAVGGPQQDDGGRCDAGARGVVEGEEPSLASPVGPVQGGQVGDGEGHRRHTSARFHQGEDPQQVVRRQDVAEAEREEAGSRVVHEAHEPVRALQRRLTGQVDERPPQEQPEEPHGEKSEEGEGSVGGEKRLPAGTLQAAGQRPPHPPRRGVEAAGGPPAGGEAPGDDERGDGVGERERDEERARDDLDDLHDP